MTTSSTTTEVMHVEPLFTDAERIALAGFLAGYSGLTRDAYALDLRQYASWCQRNGLHLFQARRPDIECFGRDMEARGRARATIARRLCTVSGFYRYAVEEELLEHSRPCTCAGHAWIMSPTRSGWTATRSDPSSSPPGWVRRMSTR